MDAERQPRESASAVPPRVLRLIDECLDALRQKFIEQYLDRQHAGGDGPDGVPCVLHQLELLGMSVVILDRRGHQKPLLTTRQVEVSWHYVLGSPAEEIAARLGIAKNTVRKHISDTYQRLGAHCKVSLAQHLVANHLCEFLQGVAAGTFAVGSEIG